MRSVASLCSAACGAGVHRARRSCHVARCAPRTQLAACRASVSSCLRIALVMQSLCACVEDRCISMHATALSSIVVPGAFSHAQPHPIDVIAGVMRSPASFLSSSRELCLTIAIVSRLAAQHLAVYRHRGEHPRHCLRLVYPLREAL